MSSGKYGYDTDEHKRKWGGYLYDSEDYAYWFKPDQYNKAKDFDLSCPDNDDGDQAYFDWFDDFVKREGIKKEPWKRYIAKGDSLSDYWSKSSYDDLDDSDGYWSSGKGSGFSSWSGGSLSIQQIGLVRALQAAQSVVDVISDDENLTVHFISSSSGKIAQSALSYTVFESNAIMISPEPFLKEKVLGMDLTSAMALHEGSHGKWTNKNIRDIDTRLSRDTTLDGRIAHFLCNLLEDVRIEKNLVTEYPGFREYLSVLHDWVWTDKTEDSVPKDYNSITNRIATSLISVRYPEKTSILTDKSFDGEIEWWQKWAKRYRGSLNLDELVREGHARILKDDPLPPREEELPMPLDIHGIGITNVLTDKEADEIDNLLSQELEDLTSGLLGGAPRNERVIIRKPPETAGTRAVAIRNDPLVSKMRNSLVFRKAKPQRESNLLEDGDLDEDQLHRVAAKDFKVFKATSITEDIPEVSVTLLVDESSSMRGSSMSAAHRCATIMVEALKKIRGATTDVIGYTTSYQFGGVDLTRIWEPGDQPSRLGIMVNGVQMGGTPTGLAIKHAGERLIKKYEDKDKILIVVSDGYPDDPYRVEQEVGELRSKGVKVMEVAVSDFDVASQEQMYGAGNYIPMRGSDPSVVIVPLTRWLKKQL